MARKRAILVVDDDAELRDTVAELLEEEGYTAVCVPNGQEAFAILKRDADRFGLILLDLMMPMMNGWEFREAQRSDARIAKIPVVVVTASRDLHRSPIDAAAVLLKPLHLDVLLSTLESHCLPDDDDSQ